MKRKLFLTFIVVAGATIALAACQQSNDKNEAEDTYEDAASSEVEGNWDGAIKVPDAPIHIAVSFQEDEELSGFISIPNQGVDGYPLTVEEKEEEELVFTMDAAGQTLSFEGELIDDELSGTFTQAGQEFPFELVKKEQSSDEDEDGEFLSIDTEEGTLYGELKTPENKGPFPIMIIIPGSGETDRNGNSEMEDNNSLKMIAESLAEQGIASLRYDKRGVGKNKDAITEEEEDMRFDQFIADAEAWVDELGADERFSRIGIIGHSQGSLVGMKAAKDDAVDVFVSIAGLGSPFEEAFLEQLKLQLPKKLLTESEDILQSLKNGEEVEDVPTTLQSAFRPSVQPFLMSWMQYDPKEEIQALNIPALIVNGTRDLQVPESEAEKLHEAKNDTELLIVDNMNHVLKEAPDDRGGNLETYWESDLPLADGLMDGIFDFLDETDFKE